MKTAFTFFLALLSTFSALGQGQFLFNTRDSALGNNVSFLISGGGDQITGCHWPVIGPDFFVGVLVGPDFLHMQPLTPLLALNRSGADAGYTDPYGQVFTTPFPAGSTVHVAYRGFQGSTWAPRS